MLVRDSSLLSANLVWLFFLFFFFPRPFSSWPLGNPGRSRSTRHAHTGAALIQPWSFRGGRGQKGGGGGVGGVEGDQEVGVKGRGIFRAHVVLARSSRRR